MKETLTKENFWDAIEAQYPKAFKIFHDWLTTYKEENGFPYHRKELLYEGKYGRDDTYTIVTMKYHELPIAMQYGIFFQWYFECVHTFAPVDIKGEAIHMIGVSFKSIEDKLNG